MAPGDHLLIFTSSLCNSLLYKKFKKDWTEAQQDYAIYLRPKQPRSNRVGTQIQVCGTPEPTFFLYYTCGFSFIPPLFTQQIVMVSSIMCHAL
jgi:hypothetical protein